ncbi:hypothetical protein TNCV_538731 [Trichonephila clavipes]|nr:hypothetical protein TNCV_538731 [Trichonephila clavipes]
MKARHRINLNSCRATSRLVRLVEGKGKRVVPDHLQGVFPLNWVGIEPNRIKVRLVQRFLKCGEEVRGAPDHSNGVLSQNWAGNETKHTVICMVIKATDNDRRFI